MIEVMGRECGYLGLMSGLASGAARAYLPEEGVSLHDLEADLAEMIQGCRVLAHLALQASTFSMGTIRFIDGWSLSPAYAVNILFYAMVASI